MYRERKRRETRERSDERREKGDGEREERERECVYVRQDTQIHIIIRALSTWYCSRW